ncbi:MAG TPA: alpha-amylase family glycosyl hydrolase [Chloroflexia bacterium]|nr:alpha-amylase family glycosyl hydrolase [Chloroflexia bacterium]
MYMTEHFGAWQVGKDAIQGPIQFQIFFPDRARDPTQYPPTPVEQVGRNTTDYGNPQITAIQVAGDFQTHLGQANWDFTAAPHLTRRAHPKGWVWSFQTGVPLPAGFYQYKYLVTFGNGTQRKVGDPCSRYGSTEFQNSGVVVGGSDPETIPLKEPRKPLRDLIVYELMIDDFTAEYRGARAPLDAVGDKLEYLQTTLGINAILFLPWTAWPGQAFNWGYAPYQYFSVEYRYATTLAEPTEKLSRLKNLITLCHSRGIHVLMDGVFNHVGDVQVTRDGTANGFAYRWLYQNPEDCPYVGTFGGVFAGLTDLDYYTGCTQELIRDVCFYWIDEFQIDGIRFDNSTNFYLASTQQGLPQLLQDIDDHVNQPTSTNFALILEYLQEDATLVTNSTRATSYWNDALYQCCFNSLWNATLDSGIVGALNNAVGLQDDKVATTYLSNHDHSHVTWQAGARENAGSQRWYRTQPYVIALLTAPGTVLIQNGQEFGEDHWLVENDEGSGRRIKPRPLRWNFVDDGIGRPLVQLYEKLIALRKTCPALRSNNFYPDRWAAGQTQFDADGYGVDVAKGVVIYHRWGAADDGQLERFIIVLNTSAQDQYVDIPFPGNGTWQEVLSGQLVNVQAFRLADQRIPSNWGQIYFQKGSPPGPIGP